MADRVSHRANGRNTLPLFLAAVAAVALRLAAVTGDPVLDEVWSWLIALLAKSAREIFVTYADNNHILNTLVIYAWGPRAPVWAYRLPAALAGSLGLWFAYRLGCRRGTVAGYCVLILLGFSYTQILFGTEARGYGYLACCTLAAWWALEKYLDRPRLRYAFAFGLASSLGFLAHLTFMFGYFAFGIYAAMKLKWRRGSWQRLVILNGLPILTCVGLLVAYVQDISIGGGDPTPLGETLLATLSLMAGGPEFGPAAFIAAGIMAALLAASLAAEFRADRARGVMSLTAIVVAGSGAGHHQTCLRVSEIFSRSDDFRIRGRRLTVREVVSNRTNRTQRNCDLADLLCGMQSGPCRPVDSRRTGAVFGGRALDGRTLCRPVCDRVQRS